ncbi:MAG: glutathione peroxidase [Gammaproteobacteria bacterium]|nr:glutathione peroxidase [Gammaproteobacteria bacterium]
MNYKTVRQLVATIGALSMWTLATPAAAADCPDYLDHEFRQLHSSKTVNLCAAFSGKPLLIVNTASFCGFTPQFKGLEALHKRYADKGLVVLGFPSDDFRQEADSESKTAEVCYLNYGVTFTMLSPVSVKGSKAHPFFQELARQTTAPSWNFNKYLVHPGGDVVKHFGSGITPQSPTLIESIESVL